MRTLHGSLAWLLLLTACGGGASEASPKSAADEPATTTSAKPRARNAQQEDSSSDAEETRAAEGPRCDDGTCARCGSGICPSGWYCNEKDGGSCSWLAECAEKPSCSCVTRVLGPSCKCDASGGGLKVACD